MPPFTNSRYALVNGVEDDSGRTFLTERVPYGYRPLPDNVTHEVQRGETLWTIAARYYAALSRPSGFWWAIADFQPDPIFDPTIRLDEGRTLVIPSVRTLLGRVLSETRRAEEPT